MYVGSILRPGEFVRDGVIPEIRLARRDDLAVHVPDISRLIACSVCYINSVPSAS
jgi:hypothetical protein